MDAWLDQPGPSRESEALDAARLEPFLRARLPGLAAGAMVVEQFPSGFSNLTYLLRFGTVELVLRRPPFGANIRGGHDMGREYRLLGALIDSYRKVPRPLLYCEDPDVLGAPFYVMERVRGVILRARPPRGLTLTPELLHRVGEAVVDTLADLHALDYRAIGLGELGQPEGYVARQISGWIRRYAAAQTDDLPDMDATAAWLSAHMPAGSGAALIHNDFKHDNVALDPAALANGRGNVVAVLDWEMATIGDPLMDLGTTLGYWSEPGDPAAARQFNLTALPGNLTRRDVIARYEERSGRSVTFPVFYHAFGLYKIGVIVQQIYARYRKGLTQDARFAGLIDVERAMARMAIEAVASA